ncbi:hypothetical protein ElyMa_002507400 [Elysia marginata]|uniref:TNFR-Cys domain-containing protein n=1 Tax=Elysia marginata TaxID=1093978 RepID=A0AAV4GQB8_9GAST|nr:hypothetical protein ElyMa_002507400 [Elysia marginata]
MSLWPGFLRLPPLLLLLLGLVLVVDCERLCPKGFYFVTQLGRCRKCATGCPEEDIITPCSEFANVICQWPASSREFYPAETFGGSEDTARTLMKPRPAGDEESNNEGERELSMEEKDRNLLKTMFALIALLCLLIIVTTVVVVVVCLKLQHALVIKQTEEPDVDDADSGYVVIRTIRDASGLRAACSDHSLYLQDEHSVHPPLLASEDTGLGSSDAPSSFSSPGQPLCFLPRVYTPQRRLLTYDADDVFESDDQAQHHMIPQVPDNSPPRLSAANRAYFSSLQRHKDKSRRKKKKAANASKVHTVSSNVGCFGKRHKEHRRRLDIV